MGLAVTAANDEMVMMVPVAAVQHSGQGRLGEYQRGRNVETLHSLEVVGFDRAHAARPTAAAGVVHQHVQTPELRLGLCHHGPRGFRIGDVGREDERRSVGIPNRDRRLIEQGLTPAN